MPDRDSPLIFISYRRQDSSSASRWLYSSIQKTFGPNLVFMDTESIRIGARWPQVIENALRKASFLIVVIGPNWLKVTDEYGRRRIDKEEDWVRTEIEFALKHEINLLPLLISRTAMPTKEALNPSLDGLIDHQAFELRDERWASDLDALLAELEKQGFSRLAGRPIRIPTPMLRLKELTPEEVDQALKRLPGWELMASEIPGSEPLTRTEFRRIFEFASFEDAIGFMAEASRHVSEINHHPRWENLWRSVSVWLTTWDIGSRPSKLDVDLAEYMEQLFIDRYQRAKTKKRK